MGRWKKSEPSSEILFIESQSCSGKLDERFKQRAPGDPGLGERVVKRAYANGIFGHDERAVARVPEGQSPIPHEPRKRIRALRVVRRRDDAQVGAMVFRGVRECSSELLPIIETSIKCQDRARRKNLRLALVVG